MLKYILSSAMLAHCTISFSMDYDSTRSAFVNHNHASIQQQPAFAFQPPLPISNYAANNAAYAPPATYDNLNIVVNKAKHKKLKERVKKLEGNYLQDVQTLTSENKILRERIEKLEKKEKQSWSLFPQLWNRFDDKRQKWTLIGGIGGTVMTVALIYRIFSPRK